MSEVGLIESTHKWPNSGGLDDQEAGLVRWYDIIQAIKIDHETDILTKTNKG